MPSNWVKALKQYNEGTCCWCIPRKESKEYDQVREIMQKIKNPPQKRKVRPVSVKTESIMEKTSQPQTMEVPKVKRKLRLAEEKKDEYFKYKEEAFADTYAIYKRVSKEPPVFESVFGITKRKLIQDGEPVKEVTIKRNDKGTVLRTLKYIPETDEYFAYGIRGDNKGQIVATLSPYKPATFEMDFISGKRDEAKYYEDYDEKERSEIKKAIEDKKKKTARKDIAILTKRAIDEDEEIKKLYTELAKLYDPIDELHAEHKEFISKLPSGVERNKKELELYEFRYAERMKLKKLEEKILQKISKRKTQIRKKIIEENS